MQLLFIDAGFLLSRAFLNAFTKMHEIDYHRELSTFPRFMDAFGPWFVVIPVAWCILACVRGRAEGGDTSISAVQVIAGILLTAAIGCAFAYSLLVAIAVCTYTGIEPVR